MTNSLQLIPQSKYLTTKWIELQDNGLPQDTRTGDEIAIDVITRLGLKLREDDVNGGSV